MIIRRRNRAAVARTIAFALKRRKARQEAAAAEQPEDFATNGNIYHVKRDS
ncbi:hypothetical protein M2371_004290 [Buttiauxella sp. BIGb0471]|nr:hypothetical protein [Buttiauxella sp. BIGb0471]